MPALSGVFLLLEYLVQSFAMAMHPIAEKVIAFIERNEMLGGARGVVVAVSGGADSVALLDILNGIAPHSLHVAHLNHKLRGDESDEDAEFVKRLAGRLTLPFRMNDADVALAAQTKGRGIEEIAREIRYNFLVQVARELACSRIATGHTMSDQAETFLLRLVRGAGLRGLAAMRPVSAVPGFDGEMCGEGDEEMGTGSEVEKGEGANIKQQDTEQSAEHIDASPHRRVTPSPTLPVSSSPLLIRPLLCLTREEVEAYCRDRNLEYRTDQSNFETQYTRNRVRLEVLPALREINPRVVESIARAAEIAASDQDTLDHLACERLDEARDASTKRGPEKTGQDSDEERSVYRVATLNDQPAGLRRRMIIEAINRQRPAGRPDPSTQIDSSHVSSVEALLAEGSSGKRITLPGGLCVWREFDNLVFISTLEGDLQPPAYQFEITAASPLVVAGGFQITLELASHQSLEAALNQAKRLKRLAGSDWMMAALDRKSLPARLIVRPRKKGERVLVIGHTKTKKLKKLMIDHRIPPSLRNLWPIVATADDRFVWSPGLPPALEFAASDETLGLAILRASGA
jgi:tRNA(Ile)-lysidine synthase